MKNILKSLLIGLCVGLFVTPAPLVLLLVLCVGVMILGAPVAGIFAIGSWNFNVMIDYWNYFELKQIVTTVLDLYGPGIFIFSIRLGVLGLLIGLIVGHIRSIRK